MAGSVALVLPSSARPPAHLPTSSRPHSPNAGRYWPLIAITAVSVGSMFVWMQRKGSVEVGDKRPEDVPGVLRVQGGERVLSGEKVLPPFAHFCQRLAS